MLINMLSSPVTCWSEQDGTATASVVGGFQPIEYLWSDEDAQTTATATGLYEDTYSVVVTDSLGCTLTRVVTVEPTIGCFFIAEAITPNGDGYNDEWIVGGLEYFPAAEVRVFNHGANRYSTLRGTQERWTVVQQRAIAYGDYYFIEFVVTRIQSRNWQNIKPHEAFHSPPVFCGLALLWWLLRRKHSSCFAGRSSYQSVSQQPGHRRHVAETPITMQYATSGLGSMELRTMTLVATACRRIGVGGIVYSDDTGGAIKRTGIELGGSYTIV